MLLRCCNPAFDRCHDERDDLHFPRRNSQLPPIDIGCAAADSLFRFLLLNCSVTKYSACRSASRLTKCGIEVHDSWISNILAMGLLSENSRRTMCGLACPLKWMTVLVQSTIAEKITVWNRQNPQFYSTRSSYLLLAVITVTYKLQPRLLRFTRLQRTRASPSVRTVNCE